MVYCNDNDVRDMINREIKERGLNQERLAKSAGLSHQKVSRMLNKQYLKFYEVSQICDALNCDLDISIRPRDKLPATEDAKDVLRRAINILDRLERKNID